MYLSLRNQSFARRCRSGEKEFNCCRFVLACHRASQVITCWKPLGWAHLLVHTSADRRLGRLSARHCVRRARVRVITCGVGAPILGNSAAKPPLKCHHLMHCPFPTFSRRLVGWRGGGGGTLQADALLWRRVGGGGSVVKAQTRYRAGVATLEMTHRRTVAHDYLLFLMASACLLSTVRKNCTFVQANIQSP